MEFRQGNRCVYSLVSGRNLLRTLSTPLLIKPTLCAAILAQAGIFILTALIWAAILSNDVIFFSYHPLLNSLAVLLFTQGILVLQPTSTPKDKITGTYVHSVLNTLAVALAIAGLVVIEMNKASHPETRFQSLHGKMALVAYIVVGFQWVAGAAMFFLQGSVIEVDKAKSLYKYHRYVVDPRSISFAR